MQRALGEYHVGGIRTTIPFFQAVLNDEEFRRGEIDTSYIARFLDRQKVAVSSQTATEQNATDELSNSQIAAAMVASLQFTRQVSASQVSTNAQSQQPGKWKTAGRRTAVNRW
jgi:acetyl/propionyl-CoA carboxylase alpha subunit